MKLGGLRDKTNARNIAKRQAANIFANKIWTVIEPMHQTGMNLSKIALNLNILGIKTSTGKDFAPQSVKNIILRMTG